MERFVISEIKERQGWWICEDKLYGISCEFENARFNETKKFLIQGGDCFETKEEALIISTLLREMGDWLYQNHKGKVLSNGK